MTNGTCHFLKNQASSQIPTAGVIHVAITGLVFKINLAGGFVALECSGVLSHITKCAALPDNHSRCRVIAVLAAYRKYRFSMLVIAIQLMLLKI